MLEPRTKDATIPRAGNLVSVAIRARKYQVGCVVCILGLVLVQVLFGIASVPLFKLHQASWPTLTNIMESVALKGPAGLFESAEPATEAPDAVASGPKKWKLTACAMVHNEAAYLLEWFEFHRLQGVDHFALYTYFSKDLLEYYPMLYENADVWRMIDVIPARFFGQDPKRNLTAEDYRQNREWSLVDCVVRYSKHSEWVMLMDAGHFVHSKHYSNIPEFISEQTDLAVEQNAKAFTTVKIPTVRFGTSGVVEKFPTWLSPNSFTGGADIMFEPHNSPDKFPLVIETNPHRAPHRELDGNETAPVPVCKEAEDDDLQICSDASVVVLVKSGRCPPADISECIYPSQNILWPELSVIRADNHNWRALNHAKTSKYWTFRHNKTFEALDKSWYSSVRDDIKFKYIDRIRQAISRVKPRPFVEVGRSCRDDALKTQQQIMCPETHPYPFGDSGIKFLRQCCKYDKDGGQNPLQISSNSCFNESIVPCPDPPASGVARWLHRSCCIPPLFDKKLRKR